MSGGAPQQVPAFYKVLLYRNRRNGRETKRYKIRQNSVNPERTI